MHQGFGKNKLKEEQNNPEIADETNGPEIMDEDLDGVSGGGNNAVWGSSQPGGNGTTP
jgi:hypothetical protein